MPFPSAAGGLNQSRRIDRRWIALVAPAMLVGPFVLRGRAADTLTFSPTATGSTRSIQSWGYDTAWPSYENARLSILTFGGASRVDVVRVNFHEFEALQADGSLGPQSKAALDAAASLAKMAGNKPISLTPDTGAGTDAWYLDGAGGVNASRYAAMIIATARYLADRHGLSVGTVEVWNEPDYWPGQPTASQVSQITSLIKSEPLLQGVDMMGPSTLSPNTWWYDQIAGSVNVGATHKLGGSATNYIDFIQRVHSTGDAFANPEAHSLAEVILGAEYGTSEVIWWGPALNSRGQFVQASDGVRLGYAENRGDETAAAVYRSPDGKLQAFAGSFERSGTPTAYRMVSADREVYFNGVGPIRESMISATRDVQGAFADIAYGSDAIGQGTSLDGNRWTIVNRATGQVLQVANGSVVNGGAVNAATDTGTLAQRWNITRSDQGYFTILNANSGIALDMANSSLADGGVAQQWGNGDALPQTWTIDPAGNGFFAIRNGNSGKYLTGNATRAYQTSYDGSALQQWQFVLANPATTGSLVARYDFQGNANDSVGGHHATLSGAPTYVAGPTAAEGLGLSFNGSSTYATLPAGVADSTDITLSTWVKWNGGGAWQRIFDFGDDTTTNMYLTPTSGDGTMRFAITTSGAAGEEILDTSPLPTGQWMHLAVTLSGNTGVLYVDGAPRVAGRILLDPSDLTPTRNFLGRSQYADPLFNGVLDDFRIYDYALSQAEVANLVPVSRSTWTGNVNGVWSTTTQASPKNWKLTFNASGSDYVDNDTIVFDDTAARFTVSTDADVRPQVATFHNATTYTLSGSAGIAGTGRLVKNGLGTLIIANRNTYSGSTSINSGVVNLTGSLAGTPITVDAATFVESATGAISGGASLVTYGLTRLAGSNALGQLRASGPGTVTIEGGTTTLASAAIGDASGDRATLAITGGTVTCAGELWVSSITSASGTLRLSGGTLSVGSWLAVGRGGDAGVLEMTGGRINLTASPLTIASFAGNAGRVTVSGGSVVSANDIYVGEGGTGSLSISGSGSVTTGSTTRLIVGRNAGASGTFTLASGGTASTLAVVGGSGGSRLVFAGGVLKALGSGTAFVSGLTEAVVRTGGAVIDTNGQTVTVSQGLLHDPSLGATVDGGLVKRGLGTLTLSGSNTYTGLTTVTGGHLVIDGSLAGSLIVNSGGSVGGTGTLRTTLVFGGGSLAPGGSATPGVLRSTGTVTMAAGSTLAIDLASAGGGALAADALTAAGDVLLNGGVLALASPDTLAARWLASQEIITGRTVLGTFRAIDGVPLVDGSRLALTYTATSARVTVAAAGDLNIDGAIDLLDVAGFVSSGLYDTGAGGTWDRGDFNGDGLIDLLDAADFLTTGLYDTGSYAAPASAVASVPEPAGLAGAGGAVALATLIRRRRRTTCVRT